MMKFPASCEQLPILQGVESVRELRSDGSGSLHHVRSASGEESALKWIHLPDRNEAVPDAAALNAMQGQLLEELSALRALSASPQIAAVRDAAVQVAPDGSMDAFIRMELLTPLGERIQSRAFTADDAARLVSDAASALTLCHAAGVIHGNIKPTNILCAAKGYKLSDFGVSVGRLRQAQQSSYFQPLEQRQGRAAPSPLWDVYALGMTLYVLFNQGFLPHQSKPGQEAVKAAWQKCSGGSFPAPKAAPAPVAEVIARAVSAAPEKRYPTAQALSEAFCAAVASLSTQERSAPIRLQDATLLGGKSETAKPNHAAPIAIAAIVLAIVVALAVFVLPGVVNPGPAPTATPVPTAVPLTLDAQPGITGATIIISGAPAEADFTAQLRVSGAVKGQEVPVTGGVITLTELAPQTTYTLTVTAGEQSGETTLTTLAPVEKHFRAAFTELYTTIYLKSLQDQGARTLHKEEPNKLTTLTQNALSLSASPLASQEFAVLMYWRADLLETPEEFSRPYYLVLRAHGDVFVKTEAVQKASNSCAHDFTALLDECYARYGSHDFSAPVKLEVYWLDELVGATELTLTP